MNLRNIIVFSTLITTTFLSYCQNEKLNIKLSGGGITDGIELRQMNDITMQLDPPWLYTEKIPSFGFAILYRFFDNFQGGVYGSYASMLGAQEVIATGVVNGWTGADGVQYGLQANYQLLPLIIEKQLRFEVYTTGKVGCLYKWWEGYDNIKLNDNFLEAGIGLGAAINFSRKFGIFGEALGGRFYYSNFNWRAGLSFRF